MTNKLSKDKLNYFKEKLQQMKEELEDKRNINSNSDELADYDNHPADMGTEQFEQQRDAGLNLMRENQLKEIEDALQKIEDGTYGISEKSGEPIPEERLEVMPTARLLVSEEEENNE
ncbi:TraR/DksA C4-type zinc finger protein [Oceanobacillus iheyensis]|uniref:TraR/DksA C4-type zinc finger protein n=1 Tax=Oceanobacillus iheyensis TaxID=182710 RepID=UPI003629C2CE